MKCPCAEQLEKAASAFAADWGGVDEVLYGICSRYPGHAVRREVTAKLVLIDRAYAAGFERRVTPPSGSQAITVIAEFMLAHGEEIDGIIAGLAALQEPVTATSMEQIVRAHGQLQALLRQVTTDGKAPRSFAAKYLHFHRPVVPIYDSYAATRLVQLVPWKEVQPALAKPPGADEEYWSFCMRFQRLYEACLDAGIAVSVKGLDTYLWAVPAAK